MHVTRQGANDAMTPESIQAMIDRAIQRNSTLILWNDASQSLGEELRRPVQPARVCSYTDFMKCQPLNFKGTEGVVGLGLHYMVEMVHLDVHSKFLADETEKVDKYISGLPDNIHGNVMSARPKTLDDAIELANERKSDDSSRNNQQPHKKQNVAREYTAGLGDIRRLYTGGEILPLCTKCNYHHTGQCAPKCGKCKRYGHTTNDCRVNTNNNNNNNNNKNQKAGRGYECGNTEHIKKNCPKLKNCGNGNGDVFWDVMSFWHTLPMKEAKDKSEGKRLEDVPIVRDFPKDLPGIPPAQQVEFKIDLVPGAAPVAWVPYRWLQWDPVIHDCVIRYHPGETQNVVADALSGKERLGPLRVRALVMTMGLNLPKKILEAQTEALKPKNLSAEDVRGMLRKRLQRKSWNPVLTETLFLNNRSWEPCFGGLRDSDHATESYVQSIQLYRGSHQMYQDLKKLYWWPNMKVDIATYVGKCLSCSKVGQSMKNLLVCWFNQRFQNRKLSAHFLTMRENDQMEKLMRLYMKDVVTRHGVPIFIISNRDSRFTSLFWKELHEALGTRLDMSMAYHPETNGQSERTIQTLEDMLHACVIDFGKS
ncbi:putative reverse transcriptase domain-containing protein [Tanacetum coccineum]